jgi:hypothetical protein
MPRWTFTNDGSPYEGGADSSGDIDHGYKFTLTHKESGRAATVNVEAVAGAGDRLSRMNARRAVNEFVEEEDLPPRILMGADGNCFLPGD